jgi:hypothetical protein
MLEGLRRLTICELGVVTLEIHMFPLPVLDHLHAQPRFGRTASRIECAHMPTCLQPTCPLSMSLHLERHVSSIDPFKMWSGTGRGLEAFGCMRPGFSLAAYTGQSSAQY